MSEPPLSAQETPSVNPFSRFFSCFRRNRTANSEEEVLRKKVCSLIAQMRDWDGMKAAEAEQELWNLGPQAFMPLLTEIDHLSRRHLGLRLIIIFLGVAVIYLLCLLLFHKPPPVSFYWQMFTMLLLNLWLEKRSRNHALKVLARFEDVRSVGPLAEAWFQTKGETRKEIEKALIRLLPRLKASDASLLNTHQRDCLHELLGEYGNIRLTIAILQALPHVGEGRALPFVKWWAEMTERDLHKLNEFTSVAKELYGRCLQLAAQECLVLLQARLEQEQASQTLLRASSPSEMAPDTLLRPAADNTATEPQQLLRPGMRD